MSLFRTAEEHFEQRDIQTWLKHVLLTEYIKEWGTVFSRAAIQKQIEKVHFMDCFAGRGEFKSGEYGSPKLVMETLFKLQSIFEEFQENKCTFHIHTVELLEKYIEHLSGIRNESKHPNQIHIYHGAFEDTLDNLLETTDKSPAFYFIDPFGYKGAGMKDIVKIMRKQSHEVLINVMSYSLVRNLTIKKNHIELCNFFGIDEIPENIKDYIEIANDKDDPTKSKELSNKLMKLEDQIIYLYKKQLCKYFSVPLYTLSKRIHSQINSNIYFHLVFITKNRLGLSKMKDAMVNFELQKELVEKEYIEKYGLDNPSFLGDLFSDVISFHTYEYKHFKDDLLKEFGNSGPETTYGNIIDYFLQETPLPFRHKTGKSIYDFFKKFAQNNTGITTSSKSFSILATADKLYVKINSASITEQLSLFQ